MKHFPALRGLTLSLSLGLAFASSLACDDGSDDFGFEADVLYPSDSGDFGLRIVEAHSTWPPFEGANRLTLELVPPDPDPLPPPPTVAVGMPRSADGEMVGDIEPRLIPPKPGDPNPWWWELDDLVLPTPGAWVVSVTLMDTNGQMDHFEIELDVAPADVAQP